LKETLNHRQYWEDKIELTLLLVVLDIFVPKRTYEISDSRMIGVDG